MTQTTKISSAIRAVGYKTVRTFSSILNQGLYLQYDGAPGAPLLRKHQIHVSAKQEDDRFYRDIEDAIAHAVFRSPHGVYQKYSSRLAGLIYRVANKQGAEISRTNLEMLISNLMRALNEHRVRAMWGAIYPGSYRLICSHRLDDFAPESMHSNLVQYTLQRSLGRSPTAGKMARFESAVATALEDAATVTPKGLLYVVRELVVSCINALLEPENDNDRDNSSQQQQGGEMPEAGEEVNGDDGLDEDDKRDTAMPGVGTSDPGATDNDAEASDAPPQMSRAEALQAFLDQQQDLEQEIETGEVETDRDAKRGLRNAEHDMRDALRAKKDEVEEALEEARAEAADNLNELEDAIESARGRMAPDSDERLTQDVPTQVVLHDHETFKPYTLTPEDEADVERMNRLFTRIRFRQRSTLVHSGQRIDVNAYIQRRVDPYSNQPVFRRAMSARGFAVIMLLDLSSSMHGRRIAQATRASAMLMTALNDPHVRLQIRGFSGEAGRVNYHRIHTDSPVDLGPLVQGSTPTPFALRIAVEELSRLPEKGLLVVLTDGEPAFMSKRSKPYPKALLEDKTLEAVQYGERRGVAISALRVGERSLHPRTAKGMTRSFGNRRWSYCQDRDLGNTIVDLVRTAYARHLRTL